MRCAILVIVGVVLLVIASHTQTPGPAASVKVSSRTPWGDPDLQGVWNFAAGTPLERPAALAGKEFLTDEELAQAEREARVRSSMDRRDGAGTDADVNRDANEFWFERRKTILIRRTSLVADPPDGKLPPVTAEAERRRTAFAEYLREHPADSWDDRRLNDRCLMFLQSGPPMIPQSADFLLGFPFHFQIFQTADHVVILHEEPNRQIVPLDGRLHLQQGVRQWVGDSRGHWEGETLVVETSNFRDRLYAGVFTTEHLQLTERFTRLDADTIDYRFTVDDPTTWTKPWTAVVPIMKSDGRLYEYACHEGNYALPNILRGARAQEKAAAQAAKTGSEKQR